METNPEPQRPLERFVHPAYRPGRHEPMPQGRFIIVMILIMAAAFAFEASSESYWYGVGGGFAVTIAMVLSWHLRHSCSKAADDDDDLRKLHHVRSA